MRKRIVALVLSLVMCFGTVVHAEDHKFYKSNDELLNYAKQYEVNALRACAGADWLWQASDEIPDAEETADVSETAVSTGIDAPLGTFSTIDSNLSDYYTDSDSITIKYYYSSDGSTLYQLISISGASDKTGIITYSNDAVQFVEAW